MSDVRFSVRRSMASGLLAIAGMSLFVSNATAQSPGGPVYNPATQSYYQLVLRSGLTWPQAYDAALARPTYAGRQPRLVTVTTYAEDRFLITTWGNQILNCWIGAVRTRGANPGPWRWVNGESFSYTNWSRGEPNNVAGRENTIQYWHNGSISGIGWADISENATQARGFVVEYPKGR